MRRPPISPTDRPGAPRHPTCLRTVPSQRERAYPRRPRCQIHSTCPAGALSHHKQVGQTLCSTSCPSRCSARYRRSGRTWSGRPRRTEDLPAVSDATARHDDALTEVEAQSTEDREAPARHSASRDRPRCHSRPGAGCEVTITRLLAFGVRWRQRDIEARCTTVATSGTVLVRDVAAVVRLRACDDEGSRADLDGLAADGRETAGSTCRGPSPASTNAVRRIDPPTQSTSTAAPPASSPPACSTRSPEPSA